MDPCSMRHHSKTPKCTQVMLELPIGELYHGILSPQSERLTFFLQLILLMCLPTRRHGPHSAVPASSLHGHCRGHPVTFSHRPLQHSSQHRGHPQRFSNDCVHKTFPLCAAVLILDSRPWGGHQLILVEKQRPQIQHSEQIIHTVNVDQIPNILFQNYSELKSASSSHLVNFIWPLAGPISRELL